MRGFPTDREEKLRVLMDAVESVRDVLEAGAQEAEESATLPQASVDALYDSGLFRLKLPHVLGGAEADVVTQLDVLEAVSRIEPSAGWCLMIGAASLGGLGAFLPDDAIEEVFVGGEPPRTAGVAAPLGLAVTVSGGYEINGRWPFGSGIRHSQWVSAGARVVSDKPGYARQLRIVMPTSKLMIHDNWQVMGLRGTGSCDFSAQNLFAPDNFAWDAASTEPKRGGPLYLLGRPGFVTNEHSAFALGVGRRALDAVTEVATAKTRGYNSSNLLADRSAFQGALGECDLRLRAARALERRNPGRSLAVGMQRQDTGAVVASPNAKLRDLHYRSCGRRGLASIPVRWWFGPVHVKRATAMPPRHQRRSPAPDGQRQRLRKPRPIPAGTSRRQTDGVGPPGRRRTVREESDGIFGGCVDAGRSWVGRRSLPGVTEKAR